MHRFHSGGLGPFGELDVMSKESFPFAAFPYLWGCNMAICTLLMQQVAGASGGVGNPCKVVMSIDDNSECADGQCYFYWRPSHRYC